MRLSLPEVWRGALLRLALVWLALVGLFLPVWSAMVGQWWNSSTYNHILLIPLILVWLVGQRVGQVLQLTPRGWRPGLGFCGLGGLVWLLGEFAGLSLARDVGVVMLLQGAVLTVLGLRVAAGLLFPLAYMLFLVPVGDEIIPLLQTVTARLTMVLLALTHVPARLDGVFITTPAGYFEVAEACSGIKFLIAMIAYGALVANVCFRESRRRFAFMVVSVVVPVLANGIRAWGTIYIAGLVGIRFAASFDHVFYGWFFFAFVMALAVGLSWRFFDRPIDDPMIDPAAIEASPLLAQLERLDRGVGGHGAWAGAGVLGVAGLFLGWAALASDLAAPLPVRLALPELGGWQAVPVEGRPAWEPLHRGAGRSLRVSLADRAGHRLDVSFALYADQSGPNRAGSFGEGAMPQGSGWAWKAPGPEIAGGHGDLIEAPAASHPQDRLAVTWYRTGSLLTGSNLVLRLANMRDRLLLRHRATMVLILSAREGQGVPAARLVADFVGANGSVASWMDRIARGADGPATQPQEGRH